MAMERTLKPKRYSEPEKPATLAEIVARVPKTFALGMAEAALAEVQTRRDEARAELRRQTALPDHPVGGGERKDFDRIAELTAALHGPAPKGGKSLDDQYADAKAERRKARAAQVEKVAAVLALRRTAAGRQLAAALGEIEAARATLIEIDRLLLAEGADLDLGPMHSTDLRVLTAMAQRAQRP